MWGSDRMGAAPPVRAGELRTTLCLLTCHKTPDGADARKVA
jgi:hypothetical protein